MSGQNINLKHVSGEGADVNLYGRQLVFTHIPKSALAVHDPGTVGKRPLGANSGAETGVTHERFR